MPDGHSGVRATRKVLLVVVVAVYLAATGCALAAYDATVSPMRQVAVAPEAGTTAAVPDAGDVVLDAEFNGPAGAGPNDGLGSEIWRTDGCWQAGCMGTLASYHPENAVQDGRGNLALTARAGAAPGEICGAAGPCRFTTSRLTMLDWTNGGKASWGQRGGHFEARIKAPVGNGLWPAFWTVGSDQARLGWPGSGEIDIFEAVGQRPTVVEQFVHGYSPTGTGRNGDDIQGQHSFLTGPDISAWHTYSIDWDPSPTTGYVAWSIDGVVRHMLHAEEAGPAWRSVTIPHSILLDLAVGGWAGEPTPGALPATMMVDYVRVYRTPRS